MTRRSLFATVAAAFAGKGKHWTDGLYRFPTSDTAYSKAFAQAFDELSGGMAFRGIEPASLPPQYLPLLAEIQRRADRISGRV